MSGVLEVVEAVLVLTLSVRTSHHIDEIGCVGLLLFEIMVSAYKDDRHDVNKAYDPSHKHVGTCRLYASLCVKDVPCNDE